MSLRVCGAAAVVVAATLACNKGLEPALAPTSCPQGFVGVCGTVSFVGPLPDSTAKVFIVAFDTFPKSQNDLFKFKPQPTPPNLPLGGAPFFYTLPVPAGRYEWVLAVWQKQGTLTPTNADTLLRETGFYRDKADPTKPGVVVVPGGTSRDSIDFVVDFGNMHRVCYYFPPCP
ncbi:MAG: hypothetical protein AUI99_02420 [Gemmatimonadetes bacterium 13_1_40CM_3_69_22]|nr:MAG: hypothetical protein AUI99_02420 [Gemmatimonadetes bacterium 13_1_40CM_3_69_22]OLD93060.1 MAG: hypothetical protein AUG79_12815 [Gemmatimonadetes bacterium 13_1_20CM_4_69_16]